MPECIRLIQACLMALSEALKEYRSIRQALVAKICRPPPNAPNDKLWGEWMAVNFPMSTKAVHLLRSLQYFKASFFYDLQTDIPSQEVGNM